MYSFICSVFPIISLITLVSVTVSDPTVYKQVHKIWYYVTTYYRHKHLRGFPEQVNQCSAADGGTSIFPGTAS